MFILPNTNHPRIAACTKLKYRTLVFKCREKTNKQTNKHWQIADFEMIKGGTKPQ